MMRADWSGIWRISIFALFASAAVQPVLAQDLPRVVRVRVPEDRVNRVFPPGTELRVLPLSDFEQLEKNATQASQKRSRTGEPTIVRARHEASWDGKALVGRSEMLVEGTSSPDAVVVVDPWSPAISETRPPNDQIRMGIDEKLGIRMGGAQPRTLVLEWEQRARRGSEGRAFDLSLPAIASCRLSLDLPVDVIPEAVGMQRQGPFPSPKSDRRTWRFDGPGGVVRVRLRNASKPSDAVAKIWIDSKILIDASASPSQWRADWMVDPGTQGPRLLSLELDMGLDLIDVTGPGVASYRSEPIAAEPASSGTRVTVRFDESVAGPTPVTIRAICRMPDEGVWTIPSARPSGAIWSGGRTVLKLGSGQVVSAVRERSGRQVNPRDEERGDASGRGGLVLAFQAASALPVADVTLKRTGSDVSAEVRGHFLLSPRESARIEASITWKVERGRLLGLSADLPAGWVPERAQIRGSADPTSWHTEARTGGGMRLVARPPLAVDPKVPIILDVSAVASSGERFGPIELPRIVPVGVRIADEVWIARGEPGLNVAPSRARGLAWLDPASIKEEVTPGPPQSIPVHPLLAWRWTSADGRATLTRSPTISERRAETWVLAKVASGRLEIDFFLVTDAFGRDRADLVLATTERFDEITRWEVLNEPGRSVEAAAVPLAERAALGVPEQGSAWKIAVPKDGRSRLILHAHVQRPWSGSGAIPLLVLPARDFARGTLLVSVERGLRSVVASGELITYDASWVRRASLATLGPRDARDRTGSVPAIRSAHAMGYSASSSSVAFSTESLPAATSGGVVVSADLKTRSAGSNTALHRLSMTILPGADRIIDLVLPKGLALERANVDGQPISPIQEGETLRFSLPSTSVTQPTVELVVETLGTLRPEFPGASLPILDASWSVETPSGMEATWKSHSLVSTDPIERVKPAHRLSPPWPRRGEQYSEADRLAFVYFYKLVRETPAADLDLGDWLAKLDVGRVRIVVDRIALAENGWGPRARLSATKPNTSAADLPAEFAALGLDVSAIEETILISTRPAANLDRSRDAIASWGAALRQASTFGHDATDRFQSVARWRQESSSGASVSIPIRSSGEDEKNVERFRVSGSLAAVPPPRIQDRAAHTALAIAIGIASTFTLVMLGRFSARIRVIAIASVIACGLGFVATGPNDATEAGSALVWSGLFASGLWLGQRLRRPRPATRTSPSARPRRIATESGITVLMLIATGFSMSAAHEEPPKTEPIVVVLPFDPPFDPQKPSARAILKLSDFERLRALAESESPQSSTVFLTSALHEARREGIRDVRVASAFDVWRAGASPIPWVFPIEGARDLVATLDGKEVPITIGPTGKTGSLELSGTAHRIILHRTATLERVDGVDQLALAIPPVASARFRAEMAKAAEHIDLPTARGRTDEREGILDVALGPIRTLEVRWLGRSVTGPPHQRGSGEALALWDIEPSGDRVRLRVTASAAEGLGRLALRLGPGVMVGSVIVPGVAIDSTSTPVGSGTAWEAVLEPPLPKGESVAIEFWAPRSDPSATRRVLPKFEVLCPLDAELIVGVRRPEDWEGRLDPSEGKAPVADDAFARAWGHLPAGAVTLAGAARMTADESLVLETGPGRSRARVKSSVLLDLAPGRFDVKASAIWTETSGAAREINIAIPSDMRIARVESPGLTEWSRPTSARLRLRFDAERPSPSRSIEIVGSVPVDFDPLASGPAQGEADVPWFSWPEAEAEAGSLAIASPPDVTFQLKPSPGVKPAAPATVATSSLRVFSVPSGLSPGRLVWKIEPTGVIVKVQSLVTLHPGSAEWAASAHYEVPWGPCPPVRLRLPTAWADVAQVEIVGSKVRPKADRGPEMTTWTFVPDPPAWGGLRVRIRGVRPRPAKTFLAVPDLVPLGRAEVDRVESLVGYADASGEPTVIEGSAELQAVDSARWDAEDLPWPSLLPRNVYRVIRPGWALRFGPPGDLDGTSGSLERPRLTSAEILCTIDSDGAILGCATYLLAGRPVAFLPIALPSLAEPLSAMADGQMLRPRRDGKGRILIPLPEGGASRVVFAWRQPASRTIPAFVALPEVENAKIPTLVVISAPESVTLDANLPRIPMSVVELTRADRLAQSISDRVPALDRSSPDERARLLADCIAFEMQARTTRRAANGGTLTDSSRILEAFSRIRSALSESLASAGLEEYELSARTRAGEPAHDPLPLVRAATPPPDALRIRPLGVSWAYQFTSGEAEPKAAITWSRGLSPPSSRAVWLPLAVALAGFAAVLWFGGSNPRHLAAGAATASTTAAALSGGGWWVAGVVLVACGIGLAIDRARSRD